VENKRVCHVCGRELIEKNGILQEDALIVRKDWGYFSKKDLQIHEFIVCEACYDEWIGGFMHPVRVLDKTEVLGE